MQTIADNLQILVNEKQAIKQSLINHKKEPTDELATYSGLIDELENPDEISYCVTIDGENKAFAQVYGTEKITLTATANDIRKDTTAITDKGFISGEKVIPSYFSRYGYKYVLAEKEAIITGDETDYKNIMVTIAPLNSSWDKSTAIKYVSAENALYEATTGIKIADISKDAINKQVNLGIIVNEKSVLRYFLVREEN